MNALQELIKTTRLKQARLAEACGVSQAAISQLIRHGIAPKTGAAELFTCLTTVLAQHGAAPDTVRHCLAELQERPSTPNQNQHDEEVFTMTLKRQSLTQQARQAFGLIRNPFADPQNQDQVFLTPQSRYVREAMRDAACNGNFLAVVAESGGGKSTLKDALLDDLADNEKSVIVIEPYVLNMARTSNGAGKPMSTSHIIESVIHRVQPDSRVSGSPEVMSRRVHEALTTSAEAGNRHVLIIEEAHDLHTQTLKALKRFWELKSGMKRLLSIILIGQSELATRLSTAGADVREVVQRCDVVHLPPLPDVGEFIRHRFESAGQNADALFTPDAMEALQQRLIVGQDKDGKGTNMAYPLPVSNLAIACINFAALNGLRQVDADAVRNAQV